jgi:hypothetical protein
LKKNAAPKGIHFFIRQLKEISEKE